MVNIYVCKTVPDRPNAFGAAGSSNSGRGDAGPAVGYYAILSVLRCVRLRGCRRN